VILAAIETEEGVLSGRPQKVRRSPLTRVVEIVRNQTLQEALVLCIKKVGRCAP